MTTRLSLNYGLRWDYMGWPVDRYGRRGSFDYRLYQAPPPGGATSSGFVQTTNATHPLGGLPKVNPTLIDNTPTRNFAPRFGFAYKLTNKIAVRGGYGIFSAMRIERAMGAAARHLIGDRLCRDEGRQLTRPPSDQSGGVGKRCASGQWHYHQYRGEYIVAGCLCGLFAIRVTGRGDRGRFALQLAAGEHDLPLSPGPEVPGILHIF
ncbi:MAG: TonB-dependent receptor [Acidobacteriota bacterium]|nr:TonB-dependent receptor [Acidobacteriota bacterium]